MGRLFSKEQKEEFKDILETLGESLDITQTQFENLARSYKAVGDFLQNDPVFEPYKPAETKSAGRSLRDTPLKPPEM